MRHKVWSYDGRMRHLNLKEGLLGQPRLVADHLDRDEPLLLVVVRADHLPERSPADEAEHFVPILDVVVWREDVVGVVIVEAMVAFPG